MLVVPKLAVIGIGILTVSLIYLSSDVENEPAITLSEDQEELKEYKGGYVETYKDYFLSTKEGVNDEGWAKNLEKAKVSKANFSEKGFFKDLKAHENISREDLIGKCKVAYKTPYKEDEEQEEREEKWKEVWNLCSAANYKPSTIADMHEEGFFEEKTYGKEGKERLICTDKQNDDFWKLQEKRYKDEKPELKEWCRVAYSKKVDDTEYKSEDIYKYCSLESPEKKPGVSF